MQKIESPVLKLDSAIDETVQLIDRPNCPTYTVAKQIELMKRFKGNFILQTMFVKGSFEGKIVDNTTKKELSTWLKVVEELMPREVMIYTIDRETPAKELEKVSLEVLKEIAAEVEKLGVRTNVAG